MFTPLSLRFVPRHARQPTLLLAAQDSPHPAFLTLSVAVQGSLVPKRSVWRSNNAVATTGLVFARAVAFQRVIAQGGSAMAEWALDQDPIRMRNMSYLYGEQVGCGGHTTQHLVNCLRSKGNSSSEFTLARVTVGGCFSVAVFVLRAKVVESLHA